MMESHEFQPGDIIKFDRIITNFGNGYDRSDGKFIAPVKGTYQFSGTLYDQRNIGALLKKNGAGVIQANNGGSGTGSFDVILDLMTE